MDHKSNSSSSSSSNKHRPLIPKCVDENGKMMTTSKHFMSPTISAASKFSRKKILAERNDNSLPKIPNLDSKSVEKVTISEANRNSDVWKAVSDDSPSKPYDPITNYLSPRPTFLRYDPNRRRQILLRNENEEKEGENEADSEGDCASSCDPLAQQLQGDDEIDETDNEYEEEEEEDDERGWSFRGVFKILMLLFVLVISTLYISSMNLETPSSPVVLAVRGIRDGYRYHMMQDHGYEYVNQTVLRFEREEMIVELDEDTVELDGGQIQGFSNPEVTEEEIEEGEREVEVDEEIVEEEEEEIVEEEEEIIELDDGQIEGFSDSVETLDEPIENEEIVEEEVIVELVNGGKVPDWSDSEVCETEGFVEEPIKEGIFETERGKIGNFTEVYKIGDETESVLKAVIVLSMVLLSSIVASLALLRRFQYRKSRKNATEKDTSPAVVTEPCFEPAEPIESAAAAHFGISKAMSLSNSMEEEAYRATQESYNRSSSYGTTRKCLINSMEEEAFKATQAMSVMSLSHESRATPIIELLGELELSGMSTSLRSYGGTKNSRLIEDEVSSNSSQSKPISYPAFPSSTFTNHRVVENVSTFNTPSLPDQKKQPMKKKEGDATTPVRRSTRIRNRAFSP